MSQYLVLVTVSDGDGREFRVSDGQEVAERIEAVLADPGQAGWKVARAVPVPSHDAAWHSHDHEHPKLGGWRHEHAHGHAPQVPEFTARGFYQAWAIAGGHSPATWRRVPLAERKRWVAFAEAVTEQFRRLSHG